MQMLFSHESHQVCYYVFIQNLSYIRTEYLLRKPLKDRHLHAWWNNRYKKKEEADVNLVAFNCVLCDVCLYTVTVSYRSRIQNIDH
jgi:hypothetical protein